MDSGSTVFTVALVPTGMKAGVWISPCGVVMTPLRPSSWSGSDRSSPIRATTSNPKAVTKKRYRERLPDRISRTTVDEVAEKNQCDECV